MKPKSLFMLFILVTLLASCSPGTAAPAPTAIPTPTTAPTITPTPDKPIGTKMQSNVDGMTQLYIPAGKFQMGTSTIDDWTGDDEFPLHEVYLDSFWMDKTEVTNAQYQNCVQAGACQVPHSLSSETQISYYDNSAFAEYPVIQVDWEQANAYCKWAGRRLPTEAEWEKSARGITERLFPWEGDAKGPDFANYDIDDNWPNADTSPVSSILPGASPYGVMDLAGNVYEWVADWYAADYYAQSPAANPTGPQSGTARVIRGGAWSSDWVFVRTGSRLSFYPDLYSNDIGFRCAQSE
jgi:formylglycine-generating enzyme required for sulfatase activity